VNVDEKPCALTANLANGSGDRVRRLHRYLAVSVAASLLGASVAWALALWIAPLGAYEVTLHMDDGRFAVVLDRRAPSDRAPRHGDPAMNDSDGLHDEYVVTLATLDACSTADSGKSANLDVPAVAAALIVDVAHVGSILPCEVTSRHGPPLPASFSILRI
jgi:hypothetical protein